MLTPGALQRIRSICFGRVRGVKLLLHAAFLLWLGSSRVFGAAPPPIPKPVPITVGPTNAPKAIAPAGPLRDVKQLEEIPSGWAWAGRVALALALALLGWWAWKKWRSKAAERSLVPAIPPAVTARERLREALALIDQPQPFCFAITETLRSYLEAQFGLRATEQTTEEFLESLHQSLALDRKHKSVLEDFLTRCDLVKFAKVEPARVELEDLHQSALRLVDETENFRPPNTLHAPSAAPGIGSTAGALNSAAEPASVETAALDAQDADARYKPKELAGHGGTGGTR